MSSSFCGQIAVIEIRWSIKLMYWTLRVKIFCDISGFHAISSWREFPDDLHNFSSHLTNDYFGLFNFYGGN